MATTQSNPETPVIDDGLISSPTPDHHTLDPDWRERTTITITQVGEILGISRNSAYRAAKSGEIPVIVIGGRMVAPTAKVRRLIGEREGE